MTGNDDDGTTMIALAFTAPADAAVVEVYRKGFGQYPEYDDLGGAAPTPPASPTAALAGGWALTAVTGDGEIDEPPDRDFWYYVVFTADVRGNISSPSNLSVGALNYHLGDVSDGITPGAGDNLVDIVDVSALGFSYGAHDGDATWRNYLDIGPTSTMYVDGLPLTDNVINFEDMIVMAMNFGVVGRQIAPGEVVETTESPALRLIADGRAARVGETVTARLVLEGNESAVKGLHALVGFDAERLALWEVVPGALLHSELIFHQRLGVPEGVVVDASALGHDVTVTGSGEVATLRFEVVKSGSATPTLVETDLRDRRNRSLGVEPAEEEPLAVTVALPTTLRLVGARPNPFRSSADIVFELPEVTAVSVAIYDVSGRLVRQLVDGTLPPGEHRARWDGRTDTGAESATGIYFATFEAGRHRERQKVLRLR